MDLGLKGKRALVTGGTSGIGRGIAKTLLEEGAEVVITGRDASRAGAAAAELGAGASGRAFDLGDPSAIEAAAKELLALGPIDILVYNTGGPPPGQPLSLTEEQWDAGYRTLLRGLVQLARLVVPGMEERGWGRVLTVTSSAAKDVIPVLCISSTLRAGLRGWVKAVSKQVGAKGVLVNNILPGPVNTDRLKELEEKNPAFFKSLKDSVAVGRLGEPEELGRAAAFLCSAANTYITGTDVLVDGGATGSI